jgi:hypothetical protein
MSQSKSNPSRRVDTGSRDPDDMRDFLTAGTPERIDAELRACGIDMDHLEDDDWEEYDDYQPNQPLRF